MLARQVLQQPFNDDAEAADILIERINGIGDNVRIPRRLSEIGVRPEQIPALVQSSRGNSMNGNPRAIPDAELAAILEAAL